IKMKNTSKPFKTKKLVEKHRFLYKLRTLVQAFFFYCKNASRHILRFEKRRIREDGNGARPSR
ncbi:hypothetical protein, partial [Bacillus paralicheniformis]|uniref:hypothetical protein n=1 Tax=Bacillus paralicheniformis TaxID=1648923 RepID=UPI001E34AE41